MLFFWAVRALFYVWSRRNIRSVCRLYYREAQTDWELVPFSERLLC
jgi:hypothetical protein